MYTDGLTEARNGAGESFGDKRFVNWLKQGAAAEKTAVQLAENFLQELATFQSQDALKDDQTLLVLSKEAVLIGLDEMERSVAWQSGACAPAPAMD